GSSREPIRPISRLKVIHCLPIDSGRLTQVILGAYIQPRYSQPYIAEFFMASICSRLPHNFRCSPRTLSVLRTGILWLLLISSPWVTADQLRIAVAANFTSTLERLV